MWNALSKGGRHATCRTQITRQHDVRDDAPVRIRQSLDAIIPYYDRCHVVSPGLLPGGGKRSAYISNICRGARYHGNFWIHYDE